MFPAMDRLDFGQWLQAEREKRGWSQSELARRSGLHRQIINKTESGISEPALETYLALSEAFGISPIIMLRQAGKMPPGTNEQIRFEDWEYLLDQLPPEEQEELRQIAELKIERRKRAEEQARAVKRKPVRNPP